MPIYEYYCSNCGDTWDIALPVEDRDIYCGTQCKICMGGIFRSVGNRGGFRLGTSGNSGWAEDGYATTVGDAENFKARAKGLPEPYPSNIGREKK